MARCELGGAGTEAGEGGVRKVACNSAGVSLVSMRMLAGPSINRWASSEATIALRSRRVANAVACKLSKVIALC